MAVNQPRGETGPVRVDQGRGIAGVAILFAPDRDDAAIHRHHRVGVENGLFELAREQEADIADNELCVGGGACRGVVRHCAYSLA